MAIGDIVPWRWGSLRRFGEDRAFNPFRDEIEALHRNIDRLFTDAWNGDRGAALLSDAWTSGKVIPRLDVVEDDKAFHVTVELPGMTDRDVSVSVTDRVLAIHGEKKEEKEKKENDAYRRERAYGSFDRNIELPGDIDTGKIEAAFKNGVLTIDLPKTKEAQDRVKQIPVKAA